MACEGASACAVWEDRRNGLGDVRTSHTTDGGVTWSAADVRLDTDAAGAAGSSVPVIHRSGAVVRVAWIDTRDGLGDVRFRRSTDGGATWLGSDVRLDGGTAGAAASNGVVMTGNATDLFVAWADDRDGAPDVRLTGSVDGGATWSPDVRLDTDAAGASGSTAPTIACANRRVYGAWADDRAGAADIHFNTSP